MHLSVWIHLFILPMEQKTHSYTVWQNAKESSKTAGEPPKQSTHINMRMSSFTINLLLFQIGEYANSYQECTHRSLQTVAAQMILS